MLEDLGVKLVLGVLGGDLKDLFDWTLECEIMAARVSRPITDPRRGARKPSISSARGQSAVVDASATGPLDAPVVDFARGIGVAKIITLLEEAILIDGAPAHAIRAAEARFPRVPHRSPRGRRCCRPPPTPAAAACHACTCSTAAARACWWTSCFSNEGVGTMVHADSYRMIRPLREEDIPELLGMIGRSVRRTKLVERTYEDIQSRIGGFPCHDHRRQRRRLRGAARISRRKPAPRSPVCM